MLNQAMNRGKEIGSQAIGLVGAVVQSKESLVDAIKINPYNSNAYKDLGRILLDQEKPEFSDGLYYSVAGYFIDVLNNPLMTTLLGGAILWLTGSTLATSLMIPLVLGFMGRLACDCIIQYNKHAQNDDVLQAACSKGFVDTLEFYQKQCKQLKDRVLG